MDSWDQWLDELDREGRTRARELRDSFAARGWDDPESHARAQVHDELSRWNRDQQLSYLRDLTAGFERDVRSLDPSFVVDWFISDDGEWSYRCFGGEAWFVDASDLTAPDSDLEREHQLLSVVSMVADNMWPDEWTEPWPLCPVHRDHPLNPRLERERASWVCDRDHRISTNIGTLADFTDPHA